MLLAPPSHPRKRRGAWSLAIGGSALFHGVVLLGAYGHLGLFDPIELPFEPIEITAPSSLGPAAAAPRGGPASSPPPPQEMVAGPARARPRRPPPASPPTPSPTEEPPGEERAAPTPSSAPLPKALGKAIEVSVRLDRIRGTHHAAAVSEVARLAPDGRRLLPSSGASAPFDLVRDLDRLRVLTTNPRSRGATSFVVVPRPGLGAVAMRVALSGSRFTHWVQQGARWIAQEEAPAPGGAAAPPADGGAAGAAASSVPAVAGVAPTDPRRLVVLDDGRVVYAAPGDLGYFEPPMADDTPDGLAIFGRIPEVAEYLRMRSGPTPRSLTLSVTASDAPDLRVVAPYASDEESQRAEAWWTSRLATVQRHPMVSFLGLGAFANSIRVVRVGATIEVAAHLQEAEVATVLSLLTRVLPSVE